ncbi:hypothetical protein DO97_13260 [Neosynechococcus sphagnicola sy1]|uniref:Uncharacterized protein n=1 Tax=Neosynechococcus sphagnicola sy1 TaxID=1497020 RepID=A0A098TIT5_9CYAN|nr:hypothetical protein DO97_13260 [Neosynechococcus sphagnicola sy1]
MLISSEAVNRFSQFFFFYTRAWNTMTRRPQFFQKHSIVRLIRLTGTYKFLTNFLKPDFSVDVSGHFLLTYRCKR